jgi:WhiB family redox-sensing transcriptional regulator
MISANWPNRAACRDSDPDLFFPLDSDIASEIEAKRVCRGCPVRSECLDDAVENGMQHGIWGGLNAKERRNLKRRTQKMAAAEALRSEDRPTVSEKYCRGCEQTKPADEWGKDVRATDGLNAYCRSCTNEAAVRRRREAKEAKEAAA